MFRGVYNGMHFITAYLFGIAVCIMWLVSGEVLSSSSAIVENHQHSLGLWKVLQLQVIQDVDRQENTTIGYFEWVTPNKNVKCI